MSLATYNFGSFSSSFLTSSRSQVCVNECRWEKNPAPCSLQRTSITLTLSYNTSLLWPRHRHWEPWLLLNHHLHIGFWVHAAPEVSRLGVTVLYTHLLAAPGGPCVFPEMRAALLCSSSSRLAWSCRANPDTAEAEASRSATVGRKFFFYCAKWGMFNSDLYSLE